MIGNLGKLMWHRRVEGGKQKEKIEKGIISRVVVLKYDRGLGEE
jgi:hypothetical protein